MSCYLRQMGREDVAQVSEIDREAFPTQWPPPNYQNELRNHVAHLIVACEEAKSVPQPSVKTAPQKNPTGLVSRLKRLFNRSHFSSPELSSSNIDCIVGFVAFWIMADEAHITSIAVREAYRRQGIGELLLISTIDQAMELKASMLTLEVRVSNTGAQSLYSKYGFTQVGLRRAYYTDNREDAIVMSTDKISSVPFQARFQQLKQAHSSRRVLHLKESSS